MYLGTDRVADERPIPEEAMRATRLPPVEFVARRTRRNLRRALSEHAAPGATVHGMTSCGQSLVRGVSA